MDIHINLEMDPHTAPYVPHNQRWVAYLESIGQDMACEAETELSLTFTDNATIQYLNHTYREIDRPTDVLSFQQDMQNNLLGDVIISVEKAQLQAEEKGHSLERELALLATHGFLHLLGYDHAEIEEEKIMFELQEKLLNAHFGDCFKETQDEATQSDA